jgi:cell division protein ZapA
MSEPVVPVVVRILGKEYRIACERQDRDALVASAYYLDQRMTEIRDAGKVIGADRIAVMAALNITHDLLQDRQKGQSQSQSVNSRLRNLQHRIEAVLMTAEAPPEHGHEHQGQ